MIVSIGLLIVGLGMLYYGGEILVAGAAEIARRHKLSPIVIGVTIVGFGTSAPELAVSVDATLTDRPAIALGNVVGSNICNILLVLGTAAAIAPIALRPRSLRTDVPWVLAAAGAMAGACCWGPAGEIDRVEAGLMLALFAVFLWTSFMFAKADPDEAADDLPERNVSGARAWGEIVVGLVLLPAGAYVLVEGASAIAEALGISQRVIGLTIVAVGTSLPELAVTVVATLKKQEQIAFGNIVGSNVFNALLILGIAALLRPIAVDAHILRVDLPLVLGVSAGLIPFCLMRRIGRGGGVLFLAGYAAYVVWLFVS